MENSLISPVPEVDRRVLFVDDDPTALRSFQRALAETRFAVVTAQSADEGLALCEEAPFPVVVSDYVMPGRNGIQFLSRVRHAWPDTVCILVSGQADLHTAASAVNRIGVFRFLLKPIAPEDLRAAVRHACAHYEVLHQRRLLTLAVDNFNAELHRLNKHLDLEVHRRTEQLLAGLLNALDLRDTESKGHSKRVALYSRRLATEIGLELAETVEIERGALLHDIGKIGVSDTILRKPGTLTAEDLEQVRLHPVFGYEILRGLGFLGRARDLVRSHHERYDGTGYPDGIEGLDIYIGARVFAVIDTFDAMTTDRPYRKALPDATARTEILAQRGRQFDPECVDAFLRIPTEEIAALASRVEDTGDDEAS